jgi:hypothetical protein
VLRKNRVHWTGHSHATAAFGLFREEWEEQRKARYSVAS